jgi:hypothetical protein
MWYYSFPDDDVYDEDYTPPIRKQDNREKHFEDMGPYSKDPASYIAEDKFIIFERSPLELLQMVGCPHCPS